ncbi:hypothetical protein M404DRAFT_993242 [Pisolithus tinctorius Marx 270]|uniref:Uncharacterized protein n=1 Tax=Pisolithus tinctorius Marx 270 TaxID=870435 RepID=A0A0C3KVS0_PISTI|nr:hypothetical protein M404DRAFT_993242 [Pisolithus tinctorius Marx 270]
MVSSINKTCPGTPTSPPTSDCCAHLRHLTPKPIQSSWLVLSGEGTGQMMKLLLGPLKAGAAASYAYAYSATTIN